MAWCKGSRPYWSSSAKKNKRLLKGSFFSGSCNQRFRSFSFSIPFAWEALPLSNCASKPAISCSRVSCRPADSSATEAAYDPNSAIGIESPSCGRPHGRPSQVGTSFEATDGVIPELTPSSSISAASGIGPYALKAAADAPSGTGRPAVRPEQGHSTIRPFPDDLGVHPGRHPILTQFGRHNLQSG